MEFWIKSIGAARSPLDDLWLHEERVGTSGGLAASPRLAERVHFPRTKRPVGINVGDHFLLYGVTELGGRIIGAGIFRSRFREDDGRDEDGRDEKDIAAWPWRIDIEMLISVWHAHLGPTIDAIGMNPVKMRRRSHLRLTEEEYLAGVRALAQVAHPPKV
jgi:hypothetical protein